MFLRATFMTLKRLALVQGFCGLVFAALCAFVVWFSNPFRLKNKLEILDTKKTSDGQVLILSQRYNGNIVEPSKIEIYQSLSDNLWVAYYVDHEARYWRNGKLVPVEGQTNIFRLYRGDVLLGIVNPETYQIIDEWCPDAPRKAYRISESPLANPSRRPQNLGDFDAPQ